MTGAELFAFIESKGIKRSKVTEALGYTRQSTYSLLHSPNVTTDSLEAVARIVGTTPSKIYRFVEKMRKLGGKRHA